MSIQITVRYDDGSLQTIRTDAFVLISYEPESPDSESLIPKVYEYPAENIWPVVEGVSILGERLCVEEGPIFRAIGGAIQKVVEKGKNMVKSANEELRKDKTEN